MNLLHNLFSKKSKSQTVTLHPLSGPKTHSGGEALKVAISRNGAYAVTASKTGHLMLWDASNGKALEDQEVAGIEVYCLSVDSKGQRVVLGGSDEKFQGIAVICDFKKRSIEHVIFHRRPILNVDISPDGARIATGGADWVARVADPETYDSYFGGSHPDHVHGIRFSSDGTELISVSQDWTLKVWDIHRGALLRSFECEPDMYKIALSADTAWLAAKIGSNCQLIDIQTGLPMANWEMTGELLAVTNHPAHGALVWESIPTGAQAYSPRRQAVLGKIPYLTAPVTALDASVDGQRILIGYEDGSISFWSVA